VVGTRLSVEDLSVVESARSEGRDAGRVGDRERVLWQSRKKRREKIRMDGDQESRRCDEAKKTDWKRWLGLSSVLNHEDLAGTRED